MVATVWFAIVHPCSGRPVQVVNDYGEVCTASNATGAPARAWARLWSPQFIADGQQFVRDTSFPNPRRAGVMLVDVEHPCHAKHENPFEATVE